MFPRIALAVFALASFVAATPAPIDEKLQPIIAYKNNMGLVNPPTADSNGASARMVSGAGAALTVCVVAALL